MHNKVSFDPNKITSTTDLLEKYLGQPVAIWCHQFRYRGILQIVTEDSIVLDKARAVWGNLPSHCEKPQDEETVFSSAVIMRSSIELVWQPNWCFAPLD